MRHAVFIGFLSFLCLFLHGSAPWAQEQPKLRKAILGRWEVPGEGTAYQMTFAENGDLVISLRLDGRWHDSKARYTILGETTLEIAHPFLVFPDQPLRRRYDVSVTKDKLRLRSRHGGALTLVRMK